MIYIHFKCDVFKFTVIECFYSILKRKVKQYIKISKENVLKFQKYVCE